MRGGPKQQRVLLDSTERFEERRAAARAAGRQQQQDLSVTSAASQPSGDGPEACPRSCPGPWNASESIRAQEAGGRGGKALRSNSTIFPSYIGGRAERARDLNIHGPGTKFKLRPCCRCNHLIRACCRCNRLDVMCFYRQKVIHKNGMNTAADRWLRASTRLNPSCIRGNRGRAVFLDRISRDRRRQSPTPHRPCPSNPVRPVRQDLQVRLVWLYRKAERPDLRSGPSPGQPWLDLWSGGKKRA